MTRKENTFMEARELRRQEWLKKLDMWCAKHKISRKSGISILLETPGDNQIQFRDLFWAEIDHFRDYTAAENNWFGYKF